MLPLRIGRFRVTEHLGSGGMGEVYKAYDEKLHRWVAIKAILPTRSLNPEHRERLRCEAQAAAAISHNAVAKIYDLISEGDHDYLVFELVEGESLRTVLRRGPVPLAQAFSIGLDIAEGLEAAHASGIVHRDLKLDNVMITPEGRAKILDLGLAKVTESGRVASEVSSLPGTLSAMSPEQIRHRGDVDYRSDLFSFGTLLYQLVTNKHPFREGLPPVTLSNILTVDPPVPHKVNAEVPLSVSRLIIRLLAKDPKQRPAGAREVRKVLLKHCSERGGDTISTQPRLLMVLAIALPVLILLALAGYWFLGQRRASPALHIAVMPTEIKGTFDQRIDIAAEMVQLAAINALVSLEDAFPIATSEMNSYPGSYEEIARAAAVKEILTTSISATESDYLIYFTLKDAAQGHILGAWYAQVPTDNLQQLGNTVTAKITQNFPDYPPLEDAYSARATHQDYRDFLLVRRQASMHPHEVSWDKLLAQLKEIRTRSPQLLDAYLMEISIAAFLHRQTAHQAAVAQAEEALNQATALAPDDQRTLLAAADLALAIKDYERAKTVLDHLSKIAPGHPGLLLLKARLAEGRGDQQQALALMLQAVTIRASAQTWLDLGDLELRMGQNSMAFEHLREGHRLLPQSPPQLSDPSASPRIDRDSNQTTPYIQ